MRSDIIQLIADQANCLPSQVQLDSTLEDDLGLDELDMTLLRMGLEDEIQEPINDEDWNNCRKVQDIIDLVGEMLATH